MVKILGIEESADLISQPETFLYDVRTPPEYDRDHIEGAILLELNKFKRFPDQYLFGSDNVVFVCARGIRSLAAANLAESLGAKNVYSIDGGMYKWNIVRCKYANL